MPIRSSCMKREYFRWVWAFGFLVSIVFGSVVGSQTLAQSPLRLEELEQSAFESATRFVQDSVVQVETFGGAELVNRQVASSGPSTGTIVGADGWIITSTFHFKFPPASITVVLPDKQRKTAKLVARDFSRELALLKIEVDAPIRPVMPSDRSGWLIGQWALAIGKTFDPTIGSCSAGILSAQGRIFDKAIQTDTKISPQNYGGPLIDLQGKVMGILTPINPWIVTEGEVEQWYDSGIGFAIPLTDVLERLPKMQAGQDIYPGKVGIRWRGEDEYSQPVVIEGVTPGSPAAEGGVEIGDRVVAAGPSATNLKPVANHSQFKHAMGPLDAGMQLVLVVERGSDRKEITATLAREMPLYKEPYLGILIDPASAANAPKVSYIVPGSPAAGSGLRSGWVIESINGVRIDEKRSLENQLANLNYRVALELEVRDAAGVASRIKLDPSTRPEGDFEWDYQPEVAPEAASEPAAKPAAEPAAKPAADQAAEPADVKSQVGTIQIPISDVKNKAFAIVPSNYSQKVPHGLLVLFGDAGSLDQSQWAAAWEPFAREHRWIIAVAQSSDEKGWSFEEVEVGMRMQTWLARTYSIDRRRIAVGGFDSGSILAYITAAQFPELFRGVWLSNPKAPRGLRINPSEPFKATSYFVNSSDKGVDAFVERIRKNGYSVQRQGSDLDSSKLVEAPLLLPVQRWLRLLEAY